MGFRTAPRAGGCYSRPGLIQRKQILLKKAVELVGRHELALRLKVSDSLLQAWIKGDATMPDGMLTTLSETLVRLAEAKQPPPTRQ